MGQNCLHRHSSLMSDSRLLKLTLPTNSGMQDAVTATPLPHTSVRSKVLGVSAAADVCCSLSKSSSYLGEPGRNLDTLERLLQKSLYSNCTLGSTCSLLSTSECHLRERQVSAGVESKGPEGRSHLYDCLLGAHRILTLPCLFLWDLKW